MSTAPASTTRQETAGQTETSNDSLLAPGNEEHVPLTAEAEVEVLEAFLREEFPEEFKRTNRQVPESPVEIAIRMLQALHAHVAAGAPDVRCAETFCNKPNGHTDSHGWVHFG
jgi:hypothetical protein